jgi:hypothetical protein
MEFKWKQNGSKINLVYKSNEKPKDNFKGLTFVVSVSLFSLLCYSYLYNSKYPP